MIIIIILDKNFFKLNFIIISLEYWVPYLLIFFNINLEMNFEIIINIHSRYTIIYYKDRGFTRILYCK